MNDRGKNELKNYYEFLQDEDAILSLLHDNKKGKSVSLLLKKTCQFLFQDIERLSKKCVDIQEQNKRRKKADEKYNKDNNHLSMLSGLDELYLGKEEEEVDVETIWGQVDLQNVALQTLLKKSLKQLTKCTNGNANEKDDDNEGIHAIRLLNMDSINSSSSSDDDSDGNDQDSDDDDDDNQDEQQQKGEDEDNISRRMRERMERVMEEDGSGGSGDDEDGDDGESENFEDKGNDQNKNDNESSSSSLVDPAVEELNNGFFDILEMEAFADEEEDYLPDNALMYQSTDDATKNNKKHKSNNSEKKSFHQRQREGIAVDDDGGGSSDDDDDDDDDDSSMDGKDFFNSKNNKKNDDAFATGRRRRKYREDDEIKALYDLYGEEELLLGGGGGGGGNDEAMNMTAADFMGKPDKKYFHKWQKNSGSKQSQKTTNHKRNLSWADDEEGDDRSKEKDDNINHNWRDDDEDNDNDDNGARTDIHDDDENYGREEQDKQETKKVKNKSKIEKQNDEEAALSKDDKLLQETLELEKELLEEKPWQMRGEANSQKRPTNSLLDGTTPEFDFATKMAPIITVEHTADLEDIIKQRILKEDWDDVLPRELPDVNFAGKSSAADAPEVSQEQSKLGLGEIYEREYLKKVKGYDVEKIEKSTEEEKAKNEMSVLFANLCSKLDALSNYHYTPRPIDNGNNEDQEDGIKPANTPAIALEETIPLHVSNARNVAPQEVYGTKRGRDAILRNSETELDQVERKRLRSSKKAARRKSRKQKLADEKLISKLQPSSSGLNNPYEKRKIAEELSMARASGQVIQGDTETANKYGSSGTFFQRLQDEVREEKNQYLSSINDHEEGKKKKKKSSKSNAIML